ncbi:MAG: hypothetical protein IKQ22_03605 [Clostridia bacterium]|nr:hypothetical protein [Clostridia bacterium]
MDEENLCTEIMDNVCELQDFLLERLSDDDYTQAKEKLDEIYSNAYAIRGDM